jgi:hypothetical protein
MPPNPFNPLPEIRLQLLSPTTFEFANSITDDRIGERIALAKTPSFDKQG